MSSRRARKRPPRRKNASSPGGCSKGHRRGSRGGAAEPGLLIGWAGTQRPPIGCLGCTSGLSGQSRLTLAPISGSPVAPPTRPNPTPNEISGSPVALTPPPTRQQPSHGPAPALPHRRGFQSPVAFGRCGVCYLSPFRWSSEHPPNTHAVGAFPRLDPNNVTSSQRLNKFFYELPLFQIQATSRSLWESALLWIDLFLL